MAYLRTLLYYLFFGITLLLWAIVCLLIIKLVSKDRFYWFCIAWLHCIRKGANWILGIKVQSHGLENIPRADQPAVVVVIKHQSQFETFLVPCFFPVKFAYVFKQEIFRLPLLGWIMKQLDMLPINRGNRSEAFQKIVNEGTKRLKDGTWVAMYPEGTRVPRGKAGNYKIGAAALAVHAQVEVLPVAVTSARCWTDNPLKKVAGTVDVSFGPRISSIDQTAQQVIQQAAAWIEAEMQRLDPQAYPPKKQADSSLTKHEQQQ